MHDDSVKGAQATHRARSWRRLHQPHPGSSHAGPPFSCAARSVHGLSPLSQKDKSPARAGRLSSVYAVFPEAHITQEARLDGMLEGTGCLPVAVRTPPVDGRKLLVLGRLPRHLFNGFVGGPNGVGNVAEVDNRREITVALRNSGCCGGIFNDSDFESLF